MKLVLKTNILPQTMLSYKVNDYITLKLENRYTQIYVRGKRFLQCIRLVLNIPTDQFNDYDHINSIDEAADVYKRKTIHQNRIIHEHGARDLNQDHDITPEQEFWGHCSNIQSWVEHKYDTRLLHSNLSFPLLKELSFSGDPIAKQVLKEEIAMRFESASPTVVQYLWSQRYLQYLTREEIISVIESPQFLKSIIKNTEYYRNLDILDSIFKYLAPHYFEYKAKTMEKKQLHNIAPDITEAFGNICYNLLKSGKLEHLRKAIMGCQSMGIVVNYYEQMGEHNKVIDMCKTILEIVPKSPEVWNSLAYSLTFLGEYQKALEACKQTLNYTQDREIDNVVNRNNSVWDTVVAWNNMGWIYNYLEDYTKAVEVSKKAIELNPKFANAYNHLGFAYYKMGKVEEGIELIKKSTKLNPKYCRALSNLGLIYYELKNYEESFNACYQCLKIDMSFKEGLSLLRDLINNPDLKEFSLKYHKSVQKFSDTFLKLLIWLRKNI